MALEGGVPIGLGQVPGIPGLGGEAQVGKPQIFYHRGPLPKHRQVGLHHEMRLEENRRQEQHAAYGKEPKAIGLSHGLISIGSKLLDLIQFGQVEGAHPQKQSY
jgi:hypothetical protein